MVAPIGKLFYKEAINHDEPDVIIIGDPSLFFSKYVTRYLKNRSSKLIVDIIDLWPELFKVTLPKYISKYHNYIFYLLYQRRKKLIDDTLDPLDDSICLSNSLYKLIQETTPHIIVDCINTATALAYQDIFEQFF